MPRSSSALLLTLGLLAACGKDEEETGDTTDTDTDIDTDVTDTDTDVPDTDTDTDVVETDTDTDVVATGPGDPVDVVSDVGAPGSPAILDWTGECTDEVTFFGLYTVGGKASPYAVLNLWETQAPVGQGWNEEHDAFKDGLTLTRVSSPNDVGDDGAGTVGTLFGCAMTEPFDLSNLTYALRLYDAEGRLADCIVFGDSPATVTDGTYTTVGGAPSSPSELFNCRLAM